MKQPLHKRVIAGASWCAVILLWLCAASVYVNPNLCSYIGVVGLAFPFFLAGLLVMQAISLLFAPRQAWIPLLGLAGCFFSVRAYCPVNFPSTPPKGAIKVLSFNTAGYNGNKRDSLGHNAALDYIAMSNADIVCLQEAYVTPSTNFDSLVVQPLKAVLPYYDTIDIGANILACFSRYPILHKELICCKTANGSGAFRLLLAPGDTVLVVNCHLESMHLSPDDRQKYHTLVRDPEKSDVDSSSRMLITKISAAAADRARQATLTAEYVERHAGMSTILCGDFNDTPISFTHHRIDAAGLTDAYVAAGNGIGRSFNRDAIYVRIDNIFCSSDWEAYGSRVDHSVIASDHYPIYTFLHRDE